MLNKKQRLFISIITFFVLIFGCFTKSNGLKQHDIKPLIQGFLKRHVQYKELNDEISKRTFHNLIKRIDPGKYYLYQTDIKNFMVHEEEIDDYINENNFKYIYSIFSLYKKRFKENMILFDELISLKYDFSKDETIIIDREKIEYSKTKKEMRERWKKNIKLQLLNYLNIVKGIDKAKEKLRKKYQLLTKRISDMNEPKMNSIFINAFSTALDPHSNYFTQEEHEDFMISTKLRFEGIGASLRSEDGFVIVEKLITGGAASKLPETIKLKPSDKIIAVAQGDKESVDVIDMDLRDVVKLIRGKKGTEVRLTIIRENTGAKKQLRLVIPIIREEIKLEDKAAKSDIHIIKQGAREYRLGYIKLPSFYRDFDAIQRNDPNAKSSATDIIFQLNKLNKKNIHGMVIDLRGNPGGSLDEAIDIAGLFIDSGPIVQIKRNQNIDVLKDKIPGVYYNGPIIVLIDKFSASASEIFSGAIKDYKRGLIIGGSHTFGKGSVQSYETLHGKKGGIKITTALFYQPAGTSNQMDGIYPHITLPDISSIWEIGENKLNYPLKWKKIKSSSFSPYKIYLNRNMISKLNLKSKKRIKNDPLFQKLIKNIIKLKEKISNKTISLKEESNIEDQKKKEYERKMKNRSDKNIIDLKNDIFLKEAFNIAVDYIKNLK